MNLKYVILKSLLIRGFNSNKAQPFESFHHNDGDLSILTPTRTRWVTRPPARLAIWPALSHLSSTLSKNFRFFIRHNKSPFKRL